MRDLGSPARGRMLVVHALPDDDSFAMGGVVARYAADAWGLTLVRAARTKAGVAGYLTMLGVWLRGRFSRSELADYAPVLLFGMALFGLLFSLNLTYLESFVIGAGWGVTG